MRRFAHPRRRPLRRGTPLGLLLSLATLLVAVPLAEVTRAQDVSEGDAGESAFAVIVSANSSVEALSFDDVRAIFMLERQFWPNGRRIAVLLPPQGTPEREVLLRRVYRMTDAQLRRFWVAKLFRGEIPAVPMVLEEANAIVPAVQRSKEAVSVVVLRGMSNGVRSLAIDGLQPGQPNYPLTTSSASRSE